MQLLIISGTCGKNAEIRRMQDGTAVLNWSVAVENGKSKDGQKRDPTWYDCSLFGKRAESLQSYITKGSKLTLQGRPTAREYKGKVYMGISVNDLTFMGGSQQRSGEDRGGYDEPPPRDDLDDDVPF
jgi:single-strand DNA-binding protein